VSRIDPQSFDRILLEGMRFFARVGVLDDEKRQGQEFRVDLVLEFLRIPACDDDRLDHTVDYGLVFETVRRVVETARFDLVERLAGAVAAAVLAEHGEVLAVVVTVRKPHAPVRGRFDAMGVSIRRERGPG
jgi:dihydroneopterin aldolase